MASRLPPLLALVATLILGHRDSNKAPMRITFVLFLPFFFDILVLASPLLKPRILPQQNSFPLKPRLYNESKPPASWTGGLVARNGDLKIPQLTFDKECSNEQREEIRKAVGIAARHVVSALSYLEKLDGNTPRYLKWFGEWERTRWTWVKEVFGHIKDSLLQENVIVYDCHVCTEDGKYAYVHSNDRQKPLRMYLCPDFWDLIPLDGPMSRTSALIHESSHWDMHGGTWHSGLTEVDMRTNPEFGIISLAKRNPRATIHNAYAYQFFAVNFPPLS